jgi:hypothetical protein
MSSPNSRMICLYSSLLRQRKSTRLSSLKLTTMLTLTCRPFASKYRSQSLLRVCTSLGLRLYTPIFNAAVRILSITQVGRRRTGPCLKRRITKGLHPVFKGCAGGGDADVFTDNAYLTAPHSCFDPSVHGLDAIYESYPNATILLTVRDSSAWLDSVKRYRFQNFALLEHLKLVAHTTARHWWQQNFN